MTFSIARLALVGICIVAPAVLVRGFLISRNPVTGEERYDQPLKCYFRQSNTLYRFALFEKKNTKRSKYTVRTDTDCCYKVASRNDCCLYREEGKDKCKCGSSTTCGQIPAKKCADSFIPYKDTICIGVVKNQVSATDAKTWCKNADPKKRGSLAVIKTKEYNDFIKNKVLKGLTLNVWMGLHKLSDGQFGWVENGVETKLDTYNDWNTGNPVVAANTDCTVMDNVADWKWNNVQCTANKYALCQYSL